MMAVSALSLSHSGTGHNVDALQYYQQAFPSLQVSIRNNDDLVSDGLFLTHFLLLIYEVSGSNCNFSVYVLTILRSQPPSHTARISGLTISLVSFTLPSFDGPSMAKSPTHSSSGGCVTLTCTPCSAEQGRESSYEPSSTTRCSLGLNVFSTLLPQRATV